MKALVAIATLALVAARADAAPWSFELPEGYTEQPGAASAELATLRNVPRTVSVDAQVYTSADGSVRLTRLTWLARFDVAPNRRALESLERGIAVGNARSANRQVSHETEFAGDQLVAEQVLELERMRVTMRRIYAADTENVVHVFTVICAGPVEQLGDCERAQRSMQLILPNAAPLAEARPRADAGTNVAYVIGFVVGGVLMLGVAVWLVRRRRRH